MSAFTNIKTVSVPSVGKLPLSDKPGSFIPSAIKREHKPGRNAEDGGRIESATPAKLDLNINMLPGVDITKINAIVDEDVTIRMSDGSVHVMMLAFVTDAIGINDSDNKLSLVSNISERIA